MTSGQSGPQCLACATAKAQLETGGKKLARELRLAAETVDYPPLAWFERLAQLHEPPVAADAVDDHEFARALGKLCLTQENLLLQFSVATAQGVEPALSYRRHPRVGGKSLKTVPGQLVRRLGSVPRMYANAVPRLAEGGGYLVVRTDRREHPRPGAPVDVYVVEIFGSGSHGTGS